MENQRLVAEEERGTFDNLQLVGFKLGVEIYATDVMKIDEIIRYTEITAVPRTENYVLGVMNLRGKVIPVIDLRIRFNLDKFDFDKDTCIIVVNFDSEYIGFVVDSVIEVMRVNKNMINPNPPLVGTIGQEYILGICRYNNDLVFILDIDRVVYGANKYKESNLKKLIQGSETEEKTAEEKAKAVSDLKRNSNRDVNKNVKRKDSEEAPSSNEIEEKELIKPENTSHIVENPEKVEEKVEPKEEVAKEVEEMNEAEDIDELIKEELMKREKETEELIKKKKEKHKRQQGQEDVEPLDKKDEIPEENLTIDKLMAAELEKKETEKEKEKKNEVVFNNQDLETIDLEELKKVSKSIIEGSDDNLDKEIGKEIASIVKELKNAKDKYEDFVNSLISTRRTIPKIEENLRDINEMTTKSTDTLFNVIDSFNHYYEELLIDVENIKKYIDESNKDAALEKLNYYSSSIDEYVKLALKIYEALEFEDINSQKINRVLKLVSDVTAHFGSILGYIKNKKKTDYVLLSQEEINKILKNMGLE